VFPVGIASGAVVATFDEVSTPFDAFAIAAPGLATMLADELRELDLSVGEVTPAGVSFLASPRDLYRANLHSRLSSRVVVRIAAFEAAHFSTLEKQLRAVDWSQWVAAGQAVACRVTCRKSRLYHSGAVGERVQGAMARAVTHRAVAPADDEDDDGTSQLLLVRLDHDRCTISIDSSGALLHRRGYRQAVAKAPLRETLAAAVLRASGWDGSRPLVDPCCGSGTIPIEAAMLARRLAPGRSRSFACERWPGTRAKLWDAVRSEARSAERSTCPVRISGSDRDAGAIEAAVANATRAGVEGDIVFTQGPLSAARPQGEDVGLVAVNPPWGERIGEASALRNLYAQMGHLMRGSFVSWDLALLAADPGLVRQLGGVMRTAFSTTAGGTKVALSVWHSDQQG
jgi:putative N6-adenine-specific DNA methylase